MDVSQKDHQAIPRSVVNQALVEWHKDSSLGSAIDQLNVVSFELALGASNVRVAANRVLLQALTTLELTDPADANLLRMRYLDNKASYVVANELNIAEPTVYRRQVRALEKLVPILEAMEAQVLEQRQAELEQRLELPSYSRLFGVDAQLKTLVSLLTNDASPWIIALVGVGGVGKTSLANAAVREVIRRRPLGEVAWVTAQQTRFVLRGSTQDIAKPVSTTLGLLNALVSQLIPEKPPFKSAEGAITALRTFFEGRPTVVVIDNLETVEDMESLLSAIGYLAKPAKFLLTSREMLFGEPNVFNAELLPLSKADALSLVRFEAQKRNITELASASDSELDEIYHTVGGIPLALQLVAGLAHMHSLPDILSFLQEAASKSAERFFTYVYRWAWNSLEEVARQVLLAMPLVDENGGSIEELEQLTSLSKREIADSLTELVAFSLVESRGSSRERRYAINNLTRTFLLEQARWW